MAAQFDPTDDGEEESHLGDFLDGPGGIVDLTRCSDYSVQLTAYGFEGLAKQITDAIRAKKAETTQKSKQAAIDKYGAVMVAAAERWVSTRTDC